MDSWFFFKKKDEFKKDDPSKLTVRGKYLISKINDEELVNRKKEMISHLLTTGYLIESSPLVLWDDFLRSQSIGFRTQSLTGRQIVPNFSDKLNSFIFGQKSIHRAYFRRLNETRDDLPVDLTVRFTPKMNPDDKNKTDYLIDIVIFPCKYVKYSQLVEHQMKFKIDDLEFCSTPSIELAKDIGASLKAEEIQEPNVVNKEKSQLFKKNQIQIELPLEIVKSIYDFKKTYPTSKKVGFILMPFEKSTAYENILLAIKKVLQKNDCIGVRADDKNFHDDVFYNILTYLHGCDFGIAVFDKSEITTFNPNVSLEVGFLMALNKPVFLLKDKNLTTLQSDLAGKLYSEFDPQNIEKTISPMLKKWLLDKLSDVK
jgi:nucleoside 2-deoxyribosyltransferase